MSKRPAHSCLLKYNLRKKRKCRNGEILSWFSETECPNDEWCVSIIRNCWQLLYQAYNKIPNLRKGKEKTALETHWRGLFQYKLMPFGLCFSCPVDEEYCNSLKTLYFYFFNDCIYNSQSRTLKSPYPSPTYLRCPRKSTPSRHWTAVIGSYQFRIQIFGMTITIDNHNSTDPEN